MDMFIGTLSAIFWGVLVLSLLVFVHEGGHYLAARAFGVRVTEFFLGLPCRFKLSHKSKSHGTEVGVTPFLLGGYNRICGMEGEYDELQASAFAIVQREGIVEAEALATELDVDVERAYTLLLGLSDLAAIKPYYDPKRGERPNQREYPAAFCTVARDANMLTEYDDGHDFSLPGFTDEGEPRPLSDAQEQLNSELSHTYKGVSVPKRLVMLMAGPLVNLLLAFVLVTGVYATTEFSYYVNQNVLGEVSQNSLAQEAGLQPGDVIVRVGDVEVKDWNGLHEVLGKSCAAGQDFDIVYERDGVQATAHIDLPEGEQTSLIGVSPKSSTYRLNPLEAMQAALGYGQMVLEKVAQLIMPQHTMEVLNQSSSIVGISVMGSEAAASGIADIIALMAAISMSLGFMNLLPIPPLDGGKILIEIIQVIIRRPLSIKAQNAVSYVGLAFFAFVFIVALRNDVLRIFAG